MTRAARVSVEIFAPPLLGSSTFLLMTISTGTFGMIPVSTSTAASTSACSRRTRVRYWHTLALVTP